MVDGPGGELPSMTRREMLKLSGVAGAAAVVAPDLSIDPKQWLWSKVASGPPAVPNEMEKFLPDEEVDGIEIYGIRNPLNTEEDVKKLHDFFNQRFLFQAYFSPGIVGRRKESPQSIWEIREKLMPEKERLLQIYVKHSLYEKFEKEKQDGTGLSFSSYMKTHMDILNRFHEEATPPTKPRGKIGRIIVVDDEFDDRVQKHKNIPGIPNDMDAIWKEWWDTRGDISPKGEHEESSKIRTDKIEDKDVKVDYGRIHEWEHQLFNWPDEYVENVDKKDIQPDFIMSYSGATFGRTPWFGYCLGRNEKLKIRGYYTDPRSIGIAGQRADVKDSAVSIWGERPKDITINFVDNNGKSINGVVSVSRVKTANGDYYGKKWFEECDLIEDCKGTLNASDKWFEPMRGGYDMTYPTNWIFKINGRDGRRFLLHMPVAAFNMSKMVGKENANYTIKFYGDGNSISEKTQTLTMVPTPYPLPAQDSSDKYASMDVDGTDVRFEWSTPYEFVM